MPHIRRSRYVDEKIKESSSQRLTEDHDWNPIQSQLVKLQKALKPEEFAAAMVNVTNRSRFVLSTWMFDLLSAESPGTWPMELVD